MCIEVIFIGNTLSRKLYRWQQLVSVCGFVYVHTYMYVRFLKSGSYVRSVRTVVHYSKIALFASHKECNGVTGDCRLAMRIASLALVSLKLSRSARRQDVTLRETNVPFPLGDRKCRRIYAFWPMRVIDARIFSVVGVRIHFVASLASCRFSPLWKTWPEFSPDFSLERSFEFDAIAALGFFAGRLIRRIVLSLPLLLSCTLFVARRRSVGKIIKLVYALCE